MASIKSKFNLYLSLEINAKIRKMAQIESRSITNMIEYMLKQGIKQYEETNGIIPITEEDLYSE